MTAAHRHGVPFGALRAVKPTFMLPAVALSLAGSLAAPTVDPLVAALHATAVASALYVAHVVDEYVDGHVRDEDDPLLSVAACRAAATAGSLAFVACVASLWRFDAPAAAAATAPLWVLAVLHAPLLDSHPVAGTLDYPVGVSLAFVAAFLAQTNPVAPSVLAVAAALTVSLAGLNVALDRLDREFDATVDKQTLPVLLGDRESAFASASLHALAAALVAVFVAADLLAAVALGAVMVAALGAATVIWLSARRAVLTQMALSYPFTGLLLLAHCTLADCAGWRLLASVVG